MAVTRPSGHLCVARDLYTYEQITLCIAEIDYNIVRTVSVSKYCERDVCPVGARQRRANAPVACCWWRLRDVSRTVCSWGVWGEARSQHLIAFGALPVPPTCIRTVIFKYQRTVDFYHHTLLKREKQIFVFSFFFWNVQNHAFIWFFFFLNRL